MASLENVVNRAADAVGTYGRLRTTPERVDQLALAALSARAAHQQLELFAHWCYEESAPGVRCNILPSGQIPPGSWTPWGSSGKSGMTRTDRDILRRWLITLRSRRHYAPWFYHADERRWYVDLTRYPTRQDALDWLGRFGIKAHEWLELRQAILPKRGRRQV